jgi:hypothetical protein
MLNVAVIVLALWVPQQGTELPPIQDQYATGTPNNDGAKPQPTCENACQTMIEPCHKNCEQGSSSIPNCHKSCQTALAHCNDKCAEVAKKAKEKKDKDKGRSAHKSKDSD